MISLLLNKRMLMGLGAVVVAVAVYASASTGAFFSDTETSTGNTFTAGAIDLKVDSTSHYNGMICANGTLISAGYFWIPEGATAATFGAADATTFNNAHPGQYPLAGSACSGTWTLKDLDPTLDKFFNFTDVKPGDEGENTVSLHIDNNPAYACVDISNIHNDDNTQTEPEALVDVNGLTTGEMAQNLNFIVWKDEGATPGFQGQQTDPTEGDNIWQQGEPFLAAGSAPTTNQSYTLADPSTGPLDGGSTGYVGVEWCAGIWSGNTPGATCSGASMGNDVQTDSYAADISFRVEQARNNGNFTCAQGEVAPQTGSLTVIKHVVHFAAADAGISASSFSIGVASSSPVVGSPQPGAEAPGTTYSNLQPGTYNVSEIGPIAIQGEQVTASYTGDCDAVQHNVTVVAGQTKTCTITNTYGPLVP